MKKWLFLISIFLFACKKKTDEIPLAFVNQFPISIASYNVDVATNNEVLDFDIHYYYNLNNRIDSIKILNQTYEFDYSQVSLTGKVIVILKGNLLHNEVLTYDNTFYNLTSYTQIFGVNDTSKYLFQYDSISRLQRFLYTYNNSVNNFSITQTYKRDTVFVYNVFLNNACYNNDTIKNSSYEMSKTLPYLLLTRINNDCGEILTKNILAVLPLSSYTYKLPTKIISNNHQTDYTYLFDDNERLQQVDIATKNRATNNITKKIRIKVSY